MTAILFLDLFDTRTRTLSDFDRRQLQSRQIYSLVLLLLHRGSGTTISTSFSFHRHLLSPLSVVVCTSCLRYHHLRRDSYPDHCILRNQFIFFVLCSISSAQFLVVGGDARRWRRGSGGECGGGEEDGERRERSRCWTGRELGRRARGGRRLGGVKSSVLCFSAVDDAYVTGYRGRCRRCG
ncbi:hypothetical protein Rs2_15121 [Raphanus sativus]|nr:hypothetical protein Rs2_15121 [Raphanus sativus]